MMRAVVPWIGLSLLAAVAMPAAAQSIVQAADRGAIAAQVQSAWFAGDDAAFARVAASATGLATSSKAQDRYTLGFVQFRVLQRAIGAKRDKDAERAGAACVAATAAAVNADPKFVEAFALQSVASARSATGHGAARRSRRHSRSSPVIRGCNWSRASGSISARPSSGGTRAKLARAFGPPPPLSTPRDRAGRGVLAGSSGAPRKPTSGSAAAPVKPETPPLPSGPSSGRWLGRRGSSQPDGRSGASAGRRIFAALPRKRLM